MNLQCTLIYERFLVHITHKRTFGSTSSCTGVLSNWVVINITRVMYITYTLFWVSIIILWFRHMQSLKSGCDFCIFSNTNSLEMWWTVVHCNTDLHINESINVGQCVAKINRMMNNLMEYTMHTQMRKLCICARTHTHTCMHVQSPLNKHAVTNIRRRPTLHTVNDQIYAIKQRVFIYSTSEEDTSCKQYQWQICEKYPAQIIMYNETRDQWKNLWMTRSVPDKQKT
jgi:hypothetical protein